MIDLRQFPEQHGRAMQLLLEGVHSRRLEQHVTNCAECRLLAARLAEIDRMLRDVPGPPPDLLQRILQSRQVGTEAQEVAGRFEVLWPTSPRDRSSTQGTTLSPLILAVEADRFLEETLHSKRAERVIVVARYPIVIGRGPDMDVPVWDQSASRRHAQIDWRDNAWVLRDLESTNGTTVNGLRLGISQVVRLTSGDQIEIGRYARVTVRKIFPALDPMGAFHVIRGVLAGTSRPRAYRPRREEQQSDELRARLLGLREETVRLRDQLTSIASLGADAEAFPTVHERLTNMLALIEKEVHR